MTRVIQLTLNEAELWVLAASVPVADALMLENDQVFASCATDFVMGVVTKHYSQSDVRSVAKKLILALDPIREEAIKHLSE